MTRIPTFASTGLFIVGLAIVPLSVYAQPNAVAVPDTKAATTVKANPMGKDDPKPATAPVGMTTSTTAPVGTTTSTTAPVGKTTSTTAPATTTTKDGTAPAATMAPSGAPAKVGG